MFAKITMKLPRRHNFAIRTWCICASFVDPGHKDFLSLFLSFFLLSMTTAQFNISFCLFNLFASVWSSLILIWCHFASFWLYLCTCSSLNHLRDGKGGFLTCSLIHTPSNILFIKVKLIPILFLCNLSSFYPAILPQQRLWKISTKHFKSVKVFYFFYKTTLNFIGGACDCVYKGKQGENSFSSCVLISRLSLDGIDVTETKQRNNKKHHLIYQASKIVLPCSLLLFGITSSPPPHFPLPFIL